MFTCLQTERTQTTYATKHIPQWTNHANIIQMIKGLLFFKLTESGKNVSKKARSSLFLSSYFFLRTSQRHRWKHFR